MTHNDAYTARAHSTLNRMSKQRLPKHAGDTQTDTEEHAVDRQAAPVHQATTETSEYTDDVRGRWTDDGGQNTTALTDDAQSF
jgi:hypothetical protein